MYVNDVPRATSVAAYTLALPTGGLRQPAASPAASTTASTAASTAASPAASTAASTAAPSAAPSASLDGMPGCGEQAAAEQTAAEQAGEAAAAAAWIGRAARLLRTHGALLVPGAVPEALAAALAVELEQLLAAPRGAVDVTPSTYLNQLLNNCLNVNCLNVSLGRVLETSTWPPRRAQSRR